MALTRSALLCLRPCWTLVLAAPLLSPLPLVAQRSPDGAASTDPAAPATQQAPRAGISCQMRDGIPTTVSQTRRGEVPIIKWTSRVHDASGWTPEKRCQEVSQRFETFRAKGQLRYLTTGRINRQPVICVVASDRSDCSRADLLYTLKNDDDPSATLQRLLKVRRGASGPISETNGRIYINFDKMINDRLVGSGNQATSAVQPQRCEQDHAQGQSARGRC